MAIDNEERMEIQASQDSQVIDLTDDETIVISSDEEEDEEFVNFMEFVRKRTRRLRRELMNQACEKFLQQAPEELINNN